MPPVRTGRIDGIDGLRGLAALGVFAFHLAATADFPKRTLPPIHLAKSVITGIPSVFSFGASGVNLFFVVSGFCLCLAQERADEKPWLGQRLAAYLRNRAARIGPAYWVACCLSAAVALWLRQPLDAVLPSLASHLTFTHGFIRSHFLGLNGALWSMATEVQFYFALPLILIVSRRFSPLAVAATAVIANIGVRWYIASTAGAAVEGGISSSAFVLYQFPGRFSEFVLGIALARAYRTHDRFTFAGWALLATAPLAVWARAAGPTALVDPLLGLFYASLLAVVVRGPLVSGSGSTIGSLASHLAQFGRWSYSFFLLHAPVLSVARTLFPLPSLGPWARLGAYAAVALPVSVVLASLLYRWVEVPAGRAMSPMRRVSAS